MVLGLTTRSLAGRRPGATEAPAAGRPPSPATSRQLREGWDFLRRDPVLSASTVMVAITNLLDLAWAGVLVPVWALDTGYGAGLVGATVRGRSPRRVRRRAR